MNDTRTKILDVAEKLIQQVGCNAMSYKNISDEVGIQKPSIHHHFPKKENLIEELLNRCQISYGSNYQKIVAGSGPAPEKLRQFAGVFEDGLRQQQLCLIGTISADLNTLQNGSRTILETTIQNTAKIFTMAFKQGQEEGSLSFAGTNAETAYAFFSFLLGTQITARVTGGEKSFRSATEAVISGWEK
jgi:TetR/AcrR family transcriptional repressor of nem operon